MMIAAGAKCSGWRGGHRVNNMGICAPSREVYMKGITKPSASKRCVSMIVKVQ